MSDMYAPAPAPVQSVEDVGIVAAKYGIMAIVGPFILMVFVNFVRNKMCRCFESSAALQTKATRVNIELSETGGQRPVTSANVSNNRSSSPNTADAVNADSTDSGSDDELPSSASSTSSSSINSENLEQAAAYFAEDISDAESSDELPDPGFAESPTRSF